MSSESPVVEIFSSDGIELPVQNATVTPTNTRAILVAGSDGTNSRFITVKQASTAAVATDPSIVVSVSPNNTVSTTAPTLTKGTQAVNGWSVQNLKDAGRVNKIFVATAATGATTEALVTLTPYSAMVAGGTATTFAVTAGKTLRLQSMSVTWRNNTAVAGGVTVRLRVNSAGAAIVTSPVILALNASTALATIGSGTTSFIDFPDGVELSGTMQLAITQVSVGAVVGYDVSLFGFEY